MDTDNSLNVRVTLEYNDFLRNIFWQTFKKSWIVFILALFLTPLFIYLLIIAVFTGKFHFFILMPLMPLLAVLLTLYSIRSSAKKSFETVKGTIQWTFSDEGFETFTPMGTSKNNWSGLEEINETSSDFVLFIPKPVFAIIPKRCFQKDSEIVTFKELIRKNLGNRAKLKND